MRTGNANTESERITMALKQEDKYRPSLKNEGTRSLSLSNCGIHLSTLPSLEWADGRTTDLPVTRTVIGRLIRESDGDDNGWR